MTESEGTTGAKWTAAPSMFTYANFFFKHKMLFEVRASESLAKIKLFKVACAIFLVD